MECIFCKIIKNEVPSYTVYEDDLVKVFLDIHPSTNGDMLIVPKKHYLDTFELNEEMILHINKIIDKLYKELKEKLNMEGVTLIINTGIAQEVKHYHLHFTPRYKSDHLKHEFNKENLKPIEEIFKIIKSK